MREIKFRFWSKLLEKFVVPTDAVFVGSLKDPQMAVMQYTGLKDKNGVEIYEGDLLHYISDHGSRVVTNNKTVTWQNAGFNIQRGAHYVVMGNLYENPELLK